MITSRWCFSNQKLEIARWFLDLLVRFRRASAELGRLACAWVAVCTVIQSSPQVVWAWGRLGHRASAALAESQLSPRARAVIRDPRILILDDALSSVDTQTEERILNRLKDIMAGRTTILISHRTSTVRDADQIVVLLDGRIAERGRHDELLAAGGYYADLYQKQLLEEELERA